MRFAASPQRAAPLAQLVHEKTAGNPFFVIQFLHTLAEEGLLAFDHDAARWRWDLERIHAKGYTDNVVDLMVGKLSRLPAETQQALQQLACLGNAAEIAMLAIVLGTPEEQVHAALWPAVRQELVERLEGSYRFIHDRVQEAAYSLIPEALRAEVHLRIGRLLAAQTPPEKREEAIFEIVNQLNRGAALITQRDEREQLAELNLIAGKRAKASTAYASALTYLDAGAALLARGLLGAPARADLCAGAEPGRMRVPDRRSYRSRRSAWRRCRIAPRQRSNKPASRACAWMSARPSIRAAARSLSVSTTSGMSASSGRPIRQKRRCDANTSGSGHSSASRTIEELIDLPLMSDPASLATVDVLSKLVPPALYTDANLACPGRSARRSISASSVATATLPVSPMSCSAWSPDRVSATTRPDFASASSATNWSNNAD